MEPGQGQLHVGAGHRCKMLGRLRINNPRTRVSSGEVNDDLNEFGCKDGQEGSGEVTEDLELLRWKKNPPNQVKEKIHLFHIIKAMINAHHEDGVNTRNIVCWLGI